MEFFATCPAGFEQELARELKSLHIREVRPLRGQVAFAGELWAGYTACLWSRLASRVVLVLDRIDARDTNELYEGIRSIAWEEHLGVPASILVDASGSNDQLRNTRFVAQRTKDAIGDRMHERRGSRLHVDTHNPDIRIAVRLRGPRASVGIDLSGTPLFERGYKHSTKQTSAPHDLRADYAAFLLSCLGWEHAGAQEPLVIPYVGSGSIAAEAYGIAASSAPGMLRRRWGFSRWAGHDAELWGQLTEHAEELARQACVQVPQIIVSDIRSGFEAACRATLRAASIEAYPTFCSDASQLIDGVRGASGPCCVACDLSWIRPEEAALEARALSTLSGLGAAVPASSHITVLSRDNASDAALGREPESQCSTIVGSAEATCRAYELTSEPQERPKLSVAHVRDREIPVLVPTSEQFARRLAKVTRLREKWASREGITCYRVYDSDLPDYAVAIDYYLTSATDRFERTRGELVISEYAAPREIDPEMARRRLLDVFALAPEILKVDPTHVHVRVRSRSKGGSQYADARSGARQASSHSTKRTRERKDIQHTELPAGSRLIEEGGLCFEVALEGRLDTGIFLDNRETRSLIREMSKPATDSDGARVPKSFLNLFAYTATATCYAADGGAARTTTVDMSQPYLAWAQRNMQRNGFDDSSHTYIRADVLRWVSEQRHTSGHDYYDLVFCEPPTFSNSSKMRKSGFDVQRDHAQLLIDVSRLLTRDGVCIFSNNLRNFRPDTETLEKAGIAIEDITAQTIPEDFSRNPRIHHCYLVRRTNQ